MSAGPILKIYLAITLSRKLAISKTTKTIASLFYYIIRLVDVCFCGLQHPNKGVAENFLRKAIACLETFVFQTPTILDGLWDLFGTQKKKDEMEDLIMYLWT